MSSHETSRSTRLVQWWVRRYTAGLAEPSAAFRRVEIDSDLVEHFRHRRHAGWSERRIARERTSRLVLGVPADIGWRRERLHLRAPGRVSSLQVIPITTIASLLLAAYYLIFAVYLLGSRGSLTISSGDVHRCTGSTDMKRGRQLSGSSGRSVCCWRCRPYAEGSHRSSPTSSAFSLD